MPDQLEAISDQAGNILKLIAYSQLVKTPRYRYRIEASTSDPATRCGHERDSVIECEFASQKIAASTKARKQHRRGYWVEIYSTASDELLSGLFDDVDAASIRDFSRLSGTPGTVLDLFDREQYRAFHNSDPPADWREATPQDLQRAAGGERPNIVFLSAEVSTAKGPQPARAAAKPGLS